MKAKYIFYLLTFMFAIAEISFGQTNYPDWSVNPGNYDYDGSVTAAVQLYGVRVGTPSDLLAGFVGNECRGVVNGITIPDSYTVFMLLLYSNQSAGETMTFKYYDAAADIVYDLTETVDFTQNMTLGTPLAPFEFNIIVPEPGIESWTVNPALYEFDGSVTA
ncbi:MAG: hypothetical protein GXO91_07645, partial [FCB group bacterium]|nr:hypothetical protein [FCB group bacterium]